MDRPPGSMRTADSYRGARHLRRHAVRDPSEHLPNVIGRDQVGCGREHAVQALLHRVELLAQRQHRLPRLP